MDQEYILRLEKIEAVLDSSLPKKVDRSWTEFAFGTLAAPVPEDLAENLTAPGRDLVDRGGKRWRPLLMQLICETLGGGDAALPLAPLVELPHNGSLIHDDIEDGSDERRGKPAVHILYGVDTAINSGCFLYFLPLACLQDWRATAERKNRLYEVWGRHLRRIHLGQAMDISWHRNFSSLPGVEEYDLMCRLKTGVLARLAAELGVYGAGSAADLGGPEAENRIAAELGRAAENLGVGFQILDDVKNLTTGNPGKKRGDDIVEGKKSLPVILYLHQKADRLEFVKRCFSAARAGGTCAREVEELIGELESAGVIAEARARGTALIAEAKESLAGAAFRGLATDERAQALLSGFAALIS